MSHNFSIEVNVRTVTGKKVNQLRTKGIIPAIIYGPTRPESVAIQVPWTSLRSVLRQAGGTEMIELRVDNQPVNVLIREVQRDPTRGDVLHVDFYAVDVNALTRANVPISLIGIEAAAKRLGTSVSQMLNSIEVECLPGLIPQYIEVPLTKIQRAGDHLTVADLPQIENVTYLHDSDTVVVQTAMLTDGTTEAETEGEVVSAEVEVIGRRKDKDEFEDEE